MSDEKHIDILFVSFTPNDDSDEELLIVGKKLNDNTHYPEIINAVQGKRARDIYEELVKQKVVNE